MKISIKDFYSKYDQIRNCGFGHIYWRNPYRKTLKKLTCIVFLKHPFWNSPFYLITDEFHVKNETPIQVFPRGFWDIFSMQHYEKQTSITGGFLWSFKHFLSCSFIKTRLHQRIFRVYSQNFLRTLILDTICERLLLIYECCYILS